MDFNNSADMLLYIQNLQRQAEEAQERQRLLQQQIDEAHQIRQCTVIREYIRLYQTVFYDSMLIESSRSRRVQGKLTQIKGKYHPRKLEKLRGFREELQKIFDEACGLFPPEHRVFDSEDYMRRTLEERARPIGHESTMAIFLLDHIEIPINQILTRLKAVDEDCIFFATDVRILFELEPQEICEHMSGLSVVSPQPDINIEIEPAEVSPAMSPHRTDLGYFKPDKMCLRARALLFQDSTHDIRAVLYVCEYKKPFLLEPHEVREAMRFLAPHFDQAIGTGGRRKARRKVQRIIIQLYHCMMKGYAEFGILNTGRVIIFCRVDWKNPGTLHYHVADLFSEVAAADDADKAFSGAIGQCLAFTLLALRQSDQTGQESRQTIVETLPIWVGGSSNAPPSPNTSPSSAPAGSSSSGAPAGSTPSEGSVGASGSSASRAEESDTQRQSGQTDIGTKSNQL
ncbi:hypothetical protein E4U33_000916, partial [Claviceps sp. LM78 group G4]